MHCVVCRRYVSDHKYSITSATVPKVCERWTCVSKYLLSTLTWSRLKPQTSLDRTTNLSLKFFSSWKENLADLRPWMKSSRRGASTGVVIQAPFFLASFFEKNRQKWPNKLGSPHSWMCPAKSYNAEVWSVPEVPQSRDKLFVGSPVAVFYKYKQKLARTHVFLKPTQCSFMSAYVKCDQYGRTRVHTKQFLKILLKSQAQFSFTLVINTHM